MAYKVNEDQCVNCGACEADCPVGAISEKTTNAQLMQIHVSAAVLVLHHVLLKLFQNKHLSKKRLSELLFTSGSLLFLH